MGLIFATWDPDAITLPEHLGDLGWYFEAIMGKFDEGMEVVGTPVRNIVRANWKTEGENLSGDGYHAMITHATAVELGLFATAKDLEKLSDSVHPLTGRTVDCGHGHTVRVQRLPVARRGEQLWAARGHVAAVRPPLLRSRAAVMMAPAGGPHSGSPRTSSYKSKLKTNVDGPELHARYFRITHPLPHLGRVL